MTGEEDLAEFTSDVGLVEKNAIWNDSMQALKNLKLRKNALLL